MTKTNWQEIRARAVDFARSWSEETRESAEYQSFWDEFFKVFGLQRRSVAIYQKKVQKLSGNPGFIDLFWPGTLLAEHKSAGEDLNSAMDQAINYIAALSEDERPRYVAITDYRRMVLHDLEAPEHEEPVSFLLRDFPKHIKDFGFIAGFRRREHKPEDPVNAKAVRAIANLTDALRVANYPQEHLPHLLVRLVFCFFADDAGIWRKDSLREILDSTAEDGSDLGAKLSLVFEVLNTPDGSKSTRNERQTTLPEEFSELPYVNGGLFANHLPLPQCDRDMRSAIIRAAYFDWGDVSPAIFGSMFQSVMDENARHDLGAHYTSEKNIFKVIGPLFLDALHEELTDARSNEKKLQVLWDKIAHINLFDPACGCGNFLVVSYRELRRIETEILKRIHPEVFEGGQQSTQQIQDWSRVKISQMHGIEIDSFPAAIAKLALWLTEHQMNVELGETFNTYFANIPLTDSANIVCADALLTDWETVVLKNKCSYILGNPPFLGKAGRTSEQKAAMEFVFGKLKGAGELDFVAAWYKKAAVYIEDTKISCAFVSTNSISQGEQPGILWSALSPYKISIHFAHRTFRWSNEASGKAAVFCVVIGFSAFPADKPRLFDYDEPGGEPHEIPARNINAYLSDGPSVLILARRSPICDVPEAVFGNMPNDKGNLLFGSVVERDSFIVSEPESAPYIKTFYGADDFLQNKPRFCLWLVDIQPDELGSMPLTKERVEKVRALRLSSNRPATKKLANTPYLFAEIRQPKGGYVLIPRVTSESRHYVPMGFFPPETIVGDSCIAVPEASMYHFGVLESEMHMTWMRHVSGRLESRYRYSSELVYNNFPWPENPTSEQKKEIETASQAVLDARSIFPDSSLADLYDPLRMPKQLLDAHHTLDRVVDSAYNKPRGFKTEAERLEFLFERYSKLVNRS